MRGEVCVADVQMIYGEFPRQQGKDSAYKPMTMRAEHYTKQSGLCE